MVVCRVFAETHIDALEVEADLPGCRRPHFLRRMPFDQLRKECFLFFCPAENRRGEADKHHSDFLRRIAGHPFQKLRRSLFPLLDRLIDRVGANFRIRVGFSGPHCLIEVKPEQIAECPPPQNRFPGIMQDLDASVFVIELLPRLSRFRHKFCAVQTAESSQRQYHRFQLRVFQAFHA